ncbi:hypothetical protein ACTFIZ_010832 [Dictyostelium cf. discoideum]
MDNTENISYIISTSCSSFNGDNDHFILSIKENHFFCKSLFTNESSTKYYMPANPYIKILDKTFEISCTYINSYHGVPNKMKIYQIQYCEPDDTFSRYSYKQSFCVANINRTPNACLNFKICEGIQFIKDQYMLINL